MNDLDTYKIDPDLFCKDCINYLELKKNTCECDLDVCESTTPSTAELYKSVSF